MTELERENILVLQLVQASIGLISPEIYAISIQLQDSHVTVHFAVQKVTSALREDVDDIIFELDALIPGSMTSKALIHQGMPDSHWTGRQYRMVYMRKSASFD
ncbi:hypothetical protein [Amycolatopsis solani]|uniref:hypothetical protein n=1 Tax=Amycolatopsis solani TaxID=3028615 RepID=UPI0025B253AA|nr:hypothetical protein [Amycolatopsis sp. MEP2-6]